MVESIFSDEIFRNLENTLSGPVVFGVMRNEILRLEYWLRHYREIGCSKFVVVDNGSTDGTYECLKAQPDVISVQTEHSFGMAKFGIDWLNDFRRRLQPGQWVLFADTDECLIYPGWPQRGINDVIMEMTASGCNAMWAFMLDMYPNGPMSTVPLTRGVDLLATAPCFDSEYKFRYTPMKPWEAGRPKLQVIGGPRVRALSSIDREMKLGWLGRTWRGQIDRLLPYIPDRHLNLLFHVFPQTVPALFKSPLVRTSLDIEYENNHDVKGATYYERNAIICHFKFLADFADKVRGEVHRKEHYRRGAEYFAYQNMIERGDDLDFRFEKTECFQSSEQLRCLGLFTSYSVFKPTKAKGS